MDIDSPSPPMTSSQQLITYRPSPSSIHLTRSLLTSHFRLPPEIVSPILDYASCWTTNLTPGLLGTFYGSSRLLRTPPLGSTHSAMVDVGFGRMQAAVAVRGESPGREIRVRWVGRRVRNEEGQFGWTSGMRPVGREEDEGPPGEAFVIGIIRGRDEGWGGGASGFGKGGFSLRGEEEKRGVLRREEREIEVVFGEEAVGREVESGELVWGWRDDGRGGELVRGLKVGDRLEVGSRLGGGRWGFKLERMEIEIAYAI